MSSDSPAVPGLLPDVLVMLTFVTGVVDAVSYLGLGRVFVANMTGNVVFLGLVVGGAADLSAGSPMLAIASFVVGALAGGRLEAATGNQGGRLLALSCYVQGAVVGSAFLVSLALAGWRDGMGSHALVILLAFAMGLQTATVRRLGVADLTTTVLTMTITGLAADSKLAGGTHPRMGRRMLAIVAMFAGAEIGAVLVLGIGISAALAVATAMVLLSAVMAYGSLSSPGKRARVSAGSRARGATRVVVDDRRPRP